MFVLIFTRHLLSAQDIQADFSYDKTVGCGPLTVAFQDLSTGAANIVSWKWNFGDGDSSFVANPVHTYSQRGQFKVTLTVRDANGNVASNEYRYPQRYVVVLPVLNIGDEYLVCTMYDPNNKVTLANKPAAPYASAMGHYEWSTGDTTSSISVNTAGQYRVSYNVCGQTLRDTANVSVANASIQPQYQRMAQGWAYGSYPILVSWNYPFNYKVVDSVHINWGDGERETFGGFNLFYHNYSNPDGGSYRVSIDISLKEQNGLCDTTMVLDSIVVPKTQVRLELGPDTIFIYRGDTLVLDAGNPGATYQWRMGETSRTLRVTEANMYKVTVYKGPDFDVDSVWVRVIDRPTQPDARIGILQQDCKTIHFADSSIVHPDYPVTKRYWIYGDGRNTNDTARTPVHTYLQDGQYTVTLMVGNSKGQWDTAYQEVTISSPPPSVNLGPDTVLQGQPLTLGYNNPQGAQYTYLWSTGDTTRTKTVSTAATYWVTVTNQSCGTSASDTILVLSSDTTSVPPGKHLIAGFGAVRTGCLSFQFTDTSKVANGYITRWQWSFNDGTTDSLQNPAHTYNSSGAHQVSLIITNNYGERDTAYNMINIEAAPSFSLGDDVDTIGVNGTVLGLNNWALPDYRFLWSTGDTVRTITVTTPGTYWLKATDRFCGTSTTDTIVVSYPDTTYSLSAGFVLKRTGCRTFQFTDTTNITGGHIIKWKWQFGDGATDTVQNPVHTYNYDGPFTIILEVTDSQGKRDTAYNLIDAQGIPFVNLGPDIDTLVTGGSVQLGYYNLRGLDYDYRWSTNDTTRIINVTAPGTYWVKVTDRFCGTSASDTIIVSLKDTTSVVVAIFGYRRTACREITFNDATVVTGAHVTQWNWQFGDNTTDTVRNPVHTYSQPGTYTVGLLVTDNLGQRDSIFRSVNIPDKPFVNLGPDISSLGGGAVMLGDTLYPEYNYLWSTGDTARVIWVSQPGIYWVMATDIYCGTTASDTIVIGPQDTVPVNHTLEAATSFSRTGCRTLAFSDVSKVTGAQIVKWRWSFGDNSTDTLQNPVHTFDQPGSYTVSLVVTDNLGYRDTAFRYLTFYPKPLSYLNVDVDSLVNGGYVELGTHVQVGDNFRYLWSTGDTSRTIIVTQPGAYWLQLTDLFCNTTTVDTVVVKGPVPTGIGAVDSVNADDSMTITAQFSHPFNSNNVFTVQLLNGSSDNGRVTGENPGDILNIAAIPGTAQHPVLLVNIPDTVPCGQNYQLRIVSSSPADTTAWSSAFAIQNAPEATIRQQGDSLFAGKALTYQWYLNGAPIANAVQPSIRAKANGQYYVMVSNGESCRSTSTTLNMTITAVPEITLEQNVVKAFPNPTPGVVYLRFAKPLLKVVDIVVLDNKGNTVYRRHTQDQTGEIDLSAQPKGVYYVTISGYGRQKAMRIVVQ